MAPAIREQVLSVLGSGGEPAVLDYLVACLEDDDFHLGPDGEDAYDAFAPVLVRAWIRGRRARADGAVGVDVG